MVLVEGELVIGAVAPVDAEVELMVEEQGVAVERMSLQTLTMRICPTTVKTLRKQQWAHCGTASLP